MPKNLTTIGVKISYAVETRAGERPETEYVHIPGIKGTNDYNAQPSVGDGTTFDNLEYTTKVRLLKEAPDNVELTANMSQEFFDTWDTLMKAFKSATEEGKQIWFCIDIPGLDKSIYFNGEPSPLGLPEMGTNSILEIVAYVTPMSEPVFGDDPTYKA